MILIKIICCLFIPPLAAFLQVGLSTHFWINLILTLLGLVPGMVHGFWLVFTNRKS
jgi:uncharacterized membrane protein YqaE (UPF0057 family)